jgi:hypothetical protein
MIAPPQHPSTHPSLLRGPVDHDRGSPRLSVFLAGIASVILLASCSASP